MAALAINRMAEAGLLPVFTAASSGGDTIANDSEERTFLWVKNASGGSVTVTAAAQKTSAGVRGFGALPRGDIAVIVPAGAERLVGPFPEAFNNAAGSVAIAYSSAAGVTVAAVRASRLS